jgi:hypothetical protein
MATIVALVRDLGNKDFTRKRGDKSMRNIGGKQGEKKAY